MRFRFAVQANGPLDANTFVATYSSVAERGYGELRSLLGAADGVEIAAADADVHDPVDRGPQRQMS